LTGNVLFNAKGPQSRHCAWTCVQAPGPHQLAFLISLMKKMPGKDAHIIKEAFSSGIRLRKLKDHSIRSQLADLDWFSAYLKQVPLRRMHLLVQIYREAEHYVIGIKGVTVRK